MARIQKILHWISNICLAIGGLALVLMMFNVVADIVGKYVFRTPVPGTIQIVSWYYMVAVAFLPIGYVQLRKEHLMVELFTMKLSKRGHAFLDSLVAVGGTIYCGLLAWLVYFDAIKSTKRNEFLDVSFFDLSIWPARWMLPATFLLMALIFLFQAIVDFHFALKGENFENIAEIKKDSLENV